MPKNVHQVVGFDDPTRRCAVPRPTGVPVRRIGLVLVGVALVLALSGCAAALRVLTVVDGVYTVGSWVGSAAPAAGSESGTSDHSSVEWVPAEVNETGGEGLWLNTGPGSGRKIKVEEGTEVWLYCYADGPSVKGPNGTTSIWNYVWTPGGHTGFMADAYLATGSSGPVVPECTFH